MKTSLKWEGNNHPSPRNPESPKQDKPKVKHPKTHINQINKEQILKAAREKQQITHKGIPVKLKDNLLTDTVQARKEWQDILKVMKVETYNQDYSIQEGSHSDVKEK